MISESKHGHRYVFDAGGFVEKLACSAFQRHPSHSKQSKISLIRRQVLIHKSFIEMMIHSITGRLYRLDSDEEHTFEIDRIYMDHTNSKMANERY